MPESIDELFRLCGSHEVQFYLLRGVRRAFRWLSNHAVILFRCLDGPPVRKDWNRVSIRVKDQFTGFVAGIGDYGASGHGVGLPLINYTLNLIKTEWRMRDFPLYLAGFVLSPLFVGGEWIAKESRAYAENYFAFPSPLPGGCQ